MLEILNNPEIKVIILICFFAHNYLVIRWKQGSACLERLTDKQSVYDGMLFFLKELLFDKFCSNINRYL
jgi:hypothetical protein